MHRLNAKLTDQKVKVKGGETKTAATVVSNTAIVGNNNAEQALQLERRKRKQLTTRY